MSEARHSATVVPDRLGVLWAWECAQRGCWSGWRYRSESGAAKGAARHDKAANELDAEVHRRLYGPKGKR